MITRDVDLLHEKDCKARNLVRNSTDSKNVLLDLMSLYELIQIQSIEYEGRSYSLADVCKRPDGETGNCEVRFSFSNRLGPLLSTCLIHSHKFSLGSDTLIATTIVEYRE